MSSKLASVCAHILVRNAVRLQHALRNHPHIVQGGPPQLILPLAVIHVPGAPELGLVHAVNPDVKDTRRLDLGLSVGGGLEELWQPEVNQSVRKIPQPVRPDPLLRSLANTGSARNSGCIGEPGTNATPSMLRHLPKMEPEDPTLLVEALGERTEPRLLLPFV